MSYNIYNVMSPILIDTNRYKLSDLKIEFRKSFLKSYNHIHANHIYNYGSVPNTNDILYPIEVNKYDATGYIKLKDKDLWLHTDDNNNFFFDIIRKQEFYYRQPLVVWFLYNQPDEMVMYKYFGPGVAKVNAVTNSGLSNTMYINYKQTGDNIYMNWTNDVANATKIILGRTRLVDYTWNSQINMGQLRSDTLTTI